MYFWSSFLAVVGILACEAPTSDDTGSLTGESLYRANCMACHGEDGISGYAADLDELVPTLSDDELIEIMRSGFNDMDAVSVTIEEARLITTYLRSRFP